MPKKITTISLFVFWAVVVALLVSGLNYYQTNKTTATVNFGNVTNTTDSNTTNSVLGNKITSTLTNGKTLTLNLTEVAKHNSINNCWMIINSKVYDVTSSLSIHPGGVSSEVAYCGKEATAAFTTRSAGHAHSNNATSMLAQYFIGNLNQVLGVNAVTKKTNAITNTAPITSIGGGKREDN